MYGLVTDDPALAREGAGDRLYYTAETVGGTRRPALETAINAVSCWGDIGAVRENPEVAAVAADGTRATSDAEGHHWGTVCPTDDDYREGLLERIDRIGRVGDVRLTTVGFPGSEFCRCERCDRRFAESAVDEREAWRADVVSAFVSEAADRVDGRLAVTLFPDPYPGNLRERTGTDPYALASLVDEFFVPLCSTRYETTYWVETLARGFARELSDFEADFTIQLAADGTDTDRLEDLARQVDQHADRLVFGARGTDGDGGGAGVEAANEVIRRLRATPLEAAV